MASEAANHLLTMLEHDWVSNTSMTHLSFLLRHVLFVQYPCQESAMDRVRTYESMTEGELRGNPDLMALCTGSAFEGVLSPSMTGLYENGIPTSADLAHLYAFRTWTVDDLMPPVNKKETSSGEPINGGLGLKRSCQEGQLALAHFVTTAVPGKVNIKLRTVSKELSKYAVSSSESPSDRFLSRQLLAEKVQNVLKELWQENGSAKAMAGLTIEDEAGAAANGARAAWPDRTGDEATTNSTPMTTGSTTGVTFGFSCPNWPSVSREWATRRRRHEWPDRSDIDAVISQGCHLLTKTASGMPNDDVTWDVSFAVAERTLVCSLLAAQKKAYVILMTIYQRHLSCPAILLQEHLKHVVFWTCEQSTIAIWREDNLAECVLLLLDRLLHFLCEGNLPNYFLPAQNLLSGIKRSQQAEVIYLVSNVRRTPVESLNACFEQLTVADGATYEDLFKPVLTYLEGYPDEEHPLDCIIQSAFTIGHMFLSCDRKHEALVLFEEGSELMLQISQPDERSLGILQLTAWLYVQTGVLEKAIEYYEIICSVSKMGTAVEGFNFQSCLSNLACLYHVKSYSVPDETIQAHLVEKARGCFEVAISQEVNLQTAIHYALFLLKHGQAKKALNLLLDVQTKDVDEAVDDADLWSQATSFIEAEVDTLDDDLAKEAREAGELEVPSVVLAQYLISKCLIALHMRKEAKDSNKALTRLCRSSLNDSKDVSWSLLGYSFRALEDTRSALKAFDTAVKNNNYYTLAEENYKSCKSILSGSHSDSDDS